MQMSRVYMDIAEIEEFLGKAYEIVRCTFENAMSNAIKANSIKLQVSTNEIFYRKHLFQIVTSFTFDNEM